MMAINNVLKFTDSWFLIARSLYILVYYYYYVPYIMCLGFKKLGK